MMEKRLLLYFGGNKPRDKALGLPTWIPITKRPFIQSVNRVNHSIGEYINPFKSVIATETIDRSFKAKK